VAGLATGIGELLDSAALRAELVARATEVVSTYDWPTVAGLVLEVYHLAVEAAPRTAGARTPRNPTRSSSRVV
jgi:hypothetical protein